MYEVCAWCKKDLGEKEPIENKIITHGMCEECLAKFKKKIQEEKMRTIGCSGNVVPDSLVRDYELSLEEMTEEEKKEYLATHCEDCGDELNDDGSCSKCTYNMKYGRA